MIRFAPNCVLPPPHLPLPKCLCVTGSTGLTAISGQCVVEVLWSLAQKEFSRNESSGKCFWRFRFPISVTVLAPSEFLTLQSVLYLIPCFFLGGGGGCYDSLAYLCVLLLQGFFGNGRIRSRRVRFQPPNSVTPSSGERTQWVPLSLLFVCQSELTEFFAELTEFTVELSEAQWVLFLETVLSKQYSARFLILSVRQISTALFLSGFPLLSFSLHEESQGLEGQG